MDALVNLDRRLSRVEQILQPMAEDVQALKTDLRTLSGEVAGLQRDFTSSRREVLDAIGQLAARFDHLTRRLEERGVV